MRRSTMIMGIAAIMVFFLAALVLAQSSGMMATKSGTKAPAATKSDKNLDQAVTGFSKDWKMMSNQFNGLEEHFNMMMNIKDFSKLKDAMQKHQQMMTAMRNQMMNTQQMYSQMMSMMGSSGMMSGGNMMGSSSSGHMMGSGMMGSGNMMGSTTEKESGQSH